MNVITKFRAYRTSVSDTSDFIDVGTNSNGHYLNGRGDNPLIILTNSGEKMRITSAGNVGVGTTNPGYNLDVVGAIRVSNSSNDIMGLFSPDYGNFLHIGSWNAQGSVSKNLILNKYGGFVGIGSHTTNHTIYDRFSIWVNNSNLYFYFNDTGDMGYNTFNVVENWKIYSNGTTKNISTSSDIRIKTNIVDINDNNALSILRQIKPKTYDYIDKKEKGKYNVIGFIAQEIKEIIPNAVRIVNGYIPNFYTICQISRTDVSNILLVSSPIDLSWNPLHDQSGNAFVDVSGNASSDSSGNKVFNVKLYDQNNTEIVCKTTDVLDNRNFLIDISGSKLEDFSIENKYFLHGQEIDDFHTLDKPSIFTVVTAAVQDIDRKQQEDEAKIADLENKNAILESTVSTLQSQLATQQAQIDAILAKLNM
jgi:hypothetical protein